ncbi:hypothetical protein [Pedobacter endophyticus]|uniref:Lipoprotein n=1 Tax=Pedobacter endophyticus TaxID=2789740 RepID=A0A7U3Q3B3_9SPHI|nr:hypothetical protein [Pedobacter endophyticus]QPH37749.1 hypothetical protein IZT61_11555 [Pedobacter endophyticus]
MFKISFKFFTLIVLAMFIAACTGTNNKPVIKFSEDSSSIILKNFDATSLLQAKNAYSAGGDSLNLVSVVLLPAETDSLQDQVAINGTYTFAGDSLIFTPYKAFEKNKRYLIESYIDAKFANAGKLFSGTIKQNLQPQKQILKR